jgi:hypothetical protein
MRSICARNPFFLRPHFRQLIVERGQCDLLIHTVILPHCDLYRTIFFLCGIALVLLYHDTSRKKTKVLYSKELCRNKLNKDGAGFFVCSEAANRRNTLCISRFGNEATGEKDKPDCSGYFGTVPKQKIY